MVIFDLREEKAALAEALEARNWQILGGPAAEWSGLAQKEEHVLVVDIDRSSWLLRRSGTGVRFPAIETYGPCTECLGSGLVSKSAQEIIVEVDDEEFMLQAGQTEGDVCETCRGSGATWESRGTIIAEAWPHFRPNPDVHRDEISFEGLAPHSGIGGNTRILAAGS